MDLVSIKRKYRNRRNLIIAAFLLTIFIILLIIVRETHLDVKYENIFHSYINLIEQAKVEEKRKTPIPERDGGTFPPRCHPRCCPALCQPLCRTECMAFDTRLLITVETPTPPTCSCFRSATPGSIPRPLQAGLSPSPVRYHSRL